jgi:hypothetical protein
MAVPIPLPCAVVGRRGCLPSRPGPRARTLPQSHDCECEGQRMQRLFSLVGCGQMNFLFQAIATIDRVAHAASDKSNNLYIYSKGLRIHIDSPLL